MPKGFYSRYICTVFVYSKTHIHHIAASRDDIYACFHIQKKSRILNVWLWIAAMAKCVADSLILYILWISSSRLFLFSTVCICNQTFLNWRHARAQKRQFFNRSIYSHTVWKMEKNTPDGKSINANKNCVFEKWRWI